MQRRMASRKRPECEENTFPAFLDLGQFDYEPVAMCSELAEDGDLIPENSTSDN
jgi:hypothetical protein